MKKKTRESDKIPKKFFASTGLETRFISVHERFWPDPSRGREEEADR